MTDTTEVRRHAIALVRATLHNDVEGWAALQPVNDPVLLAHELVKITASVVDYAFHDTDQALDEIANQLAPLQEQ